MSNISPVVLLILGLLGLFLTSSGFVLLDVFVLHLFADRYIPFLLSWFAYRSSPRVEETKRWAALILGVLLAPVSCGLLFLTNGPIGEIKEYLSCLAGFSALALILYGLGQEAILRGLPESLRSKDKDEE